MNKSRNIFKSIIFRIANKVCNFLNNKILKYKTKYFVSSCFFYTAYYGLQICCSLLIFFILFSFGLRSIEVRFMVLIVIPLLIALFALPIKLFGYSVNLKAIDLHTRLILIFVATSISLMSLTSIVDDLEGSNILLEKLYLVSTVNTTTDFILQFVGILFVGVSQVFYNILNYLLNLKND